MNNPFILAAQKAFRELMTTVMKKAGEQPTDAEDLRWLDAEFAKRLEAQARAFDACKRGTEISMGNLATEMNKAFWIGLKRYKVDYDTSAAQVAMMEHMKPHFEVRLF